jgi:DNA-binding LytR/AlgR family response regulator
LQLSLGEIEMKEKLLVVIVENNQRERSHLKQILETRYADVEVVGEAENVQQAVDLFEQTKKIDIVFLNIQLGEYPRAGLDLARRLNQGDKPPWLIFTNDCEKYLREAIKEHPVAFLLKPLNTSELQEALSYIQAKKPVNADHVDNKNIKIHYYPANHKNEKGQKEKNKTWIKPSDIVFVSKNQNANTVQIKVKNGTVLHGVCGTLVSWQKELSQQYFTQIHKSHFVNLMYAETIKKHSTQKEGFELSFKCCQELLPIGEFFQKQLEERIKTWEDN